MGQPRDRFSHCSRNFETEIGMYWRKSSDGLYDVTEGDRVGEPDGQIMAGKSRWIIPKAPNPPA